MSDKSAEGISSLYKSINREAIPKVKKSRMKAFQRILEKTRVSSGSIRNTYLDTSSELVRLNEHLSSSQTISQSHSHDKFIHASRKRKTNGFSNILDDGVDSMDLKNGATVGKKSRNSINPAERSNSSHTIPSDSNHSNEIVNEDFVAYNPFLRLRARAKAFSRANAFSSDDGIQEHRNTLRANSIDCSSSTESTELRAQNFTSRDRRMPERNTARYGEDLANILNLADQLRSEELELVDSKLRSDQDNFDLSTSKTRFQEKKSQKSNLIHKNIPASKNKVYGAVSSSSLKVTQHEILHSHKNAFYNKNSSSDLTFDSNVVLHSTPRNTPVLKPQKGMVFRNTELLAPHNVMYEGDKGRCFLKSENRRSSSEKHNHVELIAESGSFYKSNPNRGEKKHVSQPYLGSDKIKSNNYFQHTNVSKAKYQTENKFTSSKRKLENQQTEVRSLLSQIKPKSRFQLSDDNNGNLYNVSESKRKLMDISIHDKINVPTSSHDDETRDSDSDSESSLFNFDKVKWNSEAKKSNESLPTNKPIRSRGKETILDLNQLTLPSHVLNNSERTLSDVSESKQRSKKMSKPGKTNVPTSSVNDLVSYYDKLKQQSNEKFPANKRIRSPRHKTILDINRPSVSSRDFNNSEGRLKEMSKQDRISRHNDSNTYSDSESSLFNFDKMKFNSETKKSNENLPGNKLIRSQRHKTILDINRPSVSSQGFNNSDGRPKEMSKQDKISSHTYSDSDSESSLFNFDKIKLNSESKKSNENLRANKLIRSQGNGTIPKLKRGVVDLPFNQQHETEAKSRKLVVRAKSVSFKKPAEWVNNRFYNYLIPFFETKFGPLRCFSVCEDMVMELYNNVKKALRKPDQQVICVNNVRKILYNVGVIKTPVDFMVYVEQYLPNEFSLIAIPKDFGSRVVGVPYPKGIGLFDDLKLS